MKNLTRKGNVGIALLVIVALVVGGWYLYQNSKQSQINDTSEVSNSKIINKNVEKSVPVNSISNQPIRASESMATTTIVLGVAMQPTYKQGTILTISRNVSEIQRGQVIVFGHDSNPNADFIKRVVGLPGETVLINGGIIYINNKQASISQIPTVKGPDVASVKLGNDEYYVLGDNTIQSADSRYFGPIKKVDITAMVTGVLK